MATDFLTLITNKKNAAKALSGKQWAYDGTYAEACIRALSVNMFPGKEGSTKPASNDSERKYAIDSYTANDSFLAGEAMNLSEAKRDYAEACDRLDCAMLVMKLEIAQLNAGVANRA